jgi:hypothetical protein
MVRLPAESYAQKRRTIAKSFLCPFGKNVLLGKRRERMNSETVLMSKRKKIALVAHDNKKGDLLEWVKFNTRYATFGFQHEANLDEGNMWPVAFALKKLTAAEEARIVALVKKAVS